MREKNAMISTIGCLLMALIVGCLVGFASTEAPNLPPETFPTENNELLVIASETVEAIRCADTAPESDTAATSQRFSSIELTDDERRELATLIWLEAGNQCAEGQQAVAEVVFNRVLHPSFPDSVHDVLHQDEHSAVPQFGSILRVDGVEPQQEQWEAINAALADPILDADVVFYSRSGENNRVWGKIQDHVFCREYTWEGQA